jgi:hypothetical protein
MYFHSDFSNFKLYLGSYLKLFVHNIRQYSFIILCIYNIDWMFCAKHTWTHLLWVIALTLTFLTIHFSAVFVLIISFLKIEFIRRHTQKLLRFINELTQTLISRFAKTALLFSNSERFRILKFYMNWLYVNSPNTTWTYQALLHFFLFSILIWFVHFTTIR